MSTAVNRRAAARRRDPSSPVLRRVLPLVLAATLGTAWLRWFATDRGLITDTAGVVLMTSLAVSICAAYSLWVAQALRKANALPRDADRSALYRRIASNLPGGAVFLFDRDLRYLLAEGTNFDEVGLESAHLEG